MPHATTLETPAAVTRCAEALQELLDKAIQLRPHPGFKKALTEAELKTELDEAFGRSKDEPGKLSATSRSTVVENAFKRIIYGILARSKLSDPGFSQVWHLLDIANILSYRDQAESSLTMALAEELFESQTTEGCRIVFEYLETRQDIMFKKSWRDKQQITLRVCNELLRRFSRADNSIFCGRIFIYLFQVFPLGDRSSVNLRGMYHTENRTTWDSTPTEPAGDSVMEVDDKNAQPNGENETQITVTPAESSEDKAKVPMKEVQDSDTLYPIFWALQDYFSNPKLLFESANLTMFKAGLEATLAKFQQIQEQDGNRPINTTAESTPKPDNKRKWSSDGSTNAAEDLLTFNPKYLTSRDLFALELSSLTFRRHVLVQSLILLEFLLFQTLTGREKQNLQIPDPTNPDKFLRPNASAVYTFELPEAEATWATDKRTDIATYLSHGPDGKLYYRMVDSVLSRDKNWVVWKSHSCQDFVLPPLEPQLFLSAQKNATKLATTARMRAAPMGAVDISFLNDTDGTQILSKLRDPARAAYPPPLSKLEDQLNDNDFDIESIGRKIHLAEVGEPILPEAGTDEPAPTLEDLKARKERLIELRDSLKWRALRIGRRGRLKYFDQLGNNNDGKMEVLFHDPPPPPPEPVETEMQDVIEVVEQEEIKIENSETQKDDKFKDGGTGAQLTKATTTTTTITNGSSTPAEKAQVVDVVLEDAPQPIAVFEFGDDR